MNREIDAELAETVKKKELRSPRNKSAELVSNERDLEQHTKLAGGGDVPPDAPLLDGPEPESRGTRPAAVFKNRSTDAATIPAATVAGQPSAVPLRVLIGPAPAKAKRPSSSQFRGG